MTSRSKRLLLAGAALLILAAFLWMRSLSSWRPVKVGATSPRIAPIGFLSEDGKMGLCLATDEGAEYVTVIANLGSGRTTNWPDENAILGFSETFPEWVVSADVYAGKIKVRDVRTGKLKQTLRWVPGIFTPQLVHTPDASTAAIVGKSTFFLWDVNSGKQLVRVPLKKPLADAGDELYALSPDGTRLIGCDWERGAIWNARSGQVLRSWTIGGDTRPVLISNDTRVLVHETFETNLFSFVDSSTGKVLWQIQRNNASPYLIEDSEVLFSTSERCEVFDLFTGHLKRQLAGPRESDGDIVRTTHDYIYTFNSKNEIWRWRAR